MQTRDWKEIREFKEILLEEYQGIAKITINRPRYRNAFTPLTTKELSEAFAIVRELQRTGLMQAIRQRAFDGMPYMGWSAGSNVAGPTLCTTNDMPIVMPASFDCMGLVPFQINPHYTDFFDPKHGGETRDDRLKEYIMVNPKATVAAIREATALLLEDGKLRLIGKPNKMKVFKTKMENTKELPLNSDLNFLLKA